jgi:hypothetical protein
MLLPIFLMLCVPLLLSPVWTHEIFQAVFKWEHAQIAADNGAIALGRADRKLFNYLRATNRVMKAMEVIHHAAHLCGAPCLAKDRLLETEIRLFHHTVGKTAAALWRTNAALAAYEVSRRGEALTRFSRKPHPPWASQTCPFCGLSTYWEIEPHALPVSAVLRVRHPAGLYAGVRMTGETLRSGPEWDYELTLEWE